MDYKNKYLKYKRKYIELKVQLGGMGSYNETEHMKFMEQKGYGNVQIRLVIRIIFHG